jgi:hypothetical protein
MFLLVFSSIHRTLWESVAQFTNILMQYELPELKVNENGKIICALDVKIILY